MNKPNYAAELTHARQLANDFIVDIDPMTISESLPDELWSEAATGRIMKLLSTFTAETTAQAKRAYLVNGEVR